MSRPGRRSLVIFADPASAESVALLRAALRAARGRDDLAISAVCDAASWPPRARAAAVARSLARPLVARLFDPAQRVVVRRAMLTSASRAAGRAGLPLIVPPDRDVNHPDFVAHLRETLRPDFALSLLVVQVFRLPLLGTFERIANFHPGRLPAYRGLMTTGWEVYRGEPAAGFCYHVMTDGIDEGPVLVEGTVPVHEHATVAQIGWAKIEQGATLVASVLDMLVSGSPGEEQRGAAGYFGSAERRAIRQVEDPSEVTWSELEQRLRAFQQLRIELGGEIYRVSRLVRLDGREPRRPRLSFTTRDGVRAEALRFEYLPLPLYRLFVRGHRTRGRASQG